MDFANHWFSSRPEGLEFNSLKFHFSCLQRSFVGTEDYSGTTKCTVSFWIKRNFLSVYQYMLEGYQTSTARTVLYWTPNNEFGCYKVNAGNETLTTEMFLDTSSWYHICTTHDIDGPSQTGTYTLYVNGKQIITRTASGAGIPFYPLWIEGDSGSTVYQTIGAYADTTTYPLSANMAEMNVIQGQILSPYDFGMFDSNGVWVPIVYEGGNYGPNGFRLTFDPSQDNGIGHDSSGNDNHFAPAGTIGFNVDDSSQADYSYLQDGPTDNYSTLDRTYPNPYPTIIYNGQLRFNHNTAIWWAHGYSTFKIPKTGKYYYEVQPLAYSGGTNQFMIGIIPSDTAHEGRGDYITNSATFPNAVAVYDLNNAVYIDGVTIQTTSENLVWGSIYGVALDMDAGTISWYQNSTHMSTIAFPAEVEEWLTAGSLYSSTSVSGQNVNEWFNFGQQPFRETVPAGFKALNSQNVPDTPVTNGTIGFRALTNTGANILDSASDNGVNNSNCWKLGINQGFSKGLWWIKDYTYAGTQHQLVDSIRGKTEAHQNPSLATVAYAHPTGNSIAWCWSAPEDFTSDGSGGVQGTKAVEGQRNLQCGFSMGRWTQQYAANGSDTLRHGLSEPPEFIILKGENNQIPYVYHKDVGPTQGLRLDSADGASTSVNLWNDTAPDGDVITVGANYTNFNNNPSMFYAWHSVPGYSKVGKYVATGGADGPRNNIGFRPALVIIKRAQNGANWIMHDSTRESHNPMGGKVLYGNTTDYNSNLGRRVDFFSNGFKISSNGGTGYNIAGETYLFIAFAEVPYFGGNVNPSNAR